MKKIFIVGCSRSGTSIIQRELVKRYNYFSLPETAFFFSPHENAEDRYKNILNFLSCTNIYSKTFLNGISKEGLKNLLESLSPSYHDLLINDSQKFNFFINIMDSVTGFHCLDGWIEKTPQHFTKVKDILDEIPDSLIIYVFRNGIDVCASIRSRSLQYNNFKKQYDIEYGYNLWNKSVNKCLEVIHNNRVIPLRYEDFINNTEKTLVELDRFLGVNVTNNCMSNINIASNQEKWKTGLLQPLKKQASKSNEVFSGEEIDYLKLKLNNHALNKVFKINSKKTS